MCRLILILILIQMGTHARAQFAIDFVLGPDYSYRHLETSSQVDGILLINNIRDERESPQIKYRIGFNANFGISDKISIKTGLRYAKQGYIEADLNDLRFGTQHNGSGGFGSDPNAPSHHFKLSSSHHFIEMPLNLRYTPGAGDLKFFIEAGFSSLLYLNTTVRNKFDSKTTTSSRDETKIGFRKMHYALNFSFGSSYAIRPKTTLFAQPILRYNIRNLADGLISEYLYSVGIEFGIRRMMLKN